MDHIVDQSLSELGEPFLSKVGDQVEEYLRDLQAFDATFKSLDRNLKSLREKASIIEDKITESKNAKVEAWLEGIKKMETELIELESNIQTEGFITEFFGQGKAEMLDKRVLDLVKQSQVLDELQLNVGDTPGKTLSVPFCLELPGAQAIDADTQITDGEVSGKKKRKRVVVEWLEEVHGMGAELRESEDQIMSQGFIRRFFGGGRATELKGRLGELVEQCNQLSDLLVDMSITKGEKLLLSELVGEEFNKNLKFLVEENVACIGIYGMAGVGKTALAMHVNNQLLEHPEESVFWITVPQGSSISVLQDRMANIAGVDLSNEHDVDRRSSRLHASLAIRRKLVLIFDDVWENLDLKKLGDPLSVEGCRLIITSRSLKVCHQIGCTKVMEVTTLRKNEAMDLFQTTLGAKLTSGVEEVAETMVDKCDGLPLGIITLARSMKGETASHVWWDALEKSVMVEDVFRVLKRSFDCLVNKDQMLQHNGYSMLQNCFLCCSSYPEDDGIKRSELIPKFIQGGFLDTKKTREGQFNQGHTILDSLVNVCLLKKINDDRVKMHRLVRAMALKITELFRRDST